MIIYYRRSGVAISTAGQTLIPTYANLKPTVAATAGTTAGIGVTPMTITIPIYSGAMHLGAAISASLMIMVLF